MSTDITGIQPPGGGTTVSEYGRLVRRFWWVLAVCMVLGVAGGVGYVATSPSTYTSTTTVLVGDTGIAAADVANSRTTTGELNLDTEAQIVTSGTVGERAADILHYDGNVYGLRNKVAVRVPPNSGVLLVDFSATDAKSAKAGSTAFARAYLENREATARSALNNRVDRLTTSLTELRAELTEASRNATESNSVQARSEVAQLTQQITTASNALAAASIQEIDPGSIISQASPAKSAGSTSLLLFGVGGAFLGLLVGLGVAMLLDRLRVGRVGVDDLLALRPGSSHVVRSTGPTGLVGDAEARRMWAWLMRFGAGDVETVAVAGVANAAETSARTALVLAETRAEDGDEVVFVNTSAVGEDALVEDGIFASVPADARSARLQPVAETSLALAVPAPKGKGESLPGHIAGMLRWLHRSTDTVVMHVSPLPTSAESVDLASDADVLLVVALLGQTKRRELDASLDLLRTYGGSPVAVVGIRTSRRRSRRTDDPVTESRRVRRSVMAAVPGFKSGRDAGAAHDAGRR